MSQNVPNAKQDDWYFGLRMVWRLTWLLFRIKDGLKASNHNIAQKYTYRINASHSEYSWIKCKAEYTALRRLDNFQWTSDKERSKLTGVPRVKSNIKRTLCWYVLAHKDFLKSLSLIQIYLRQYDKTVFVFSFFCNFTTTNHRNEKDLSAMCTRKNMIILSGQPGVYCTWIPWGLCLPRPIWCHIYGLYV